MSLWSRFTAPRPFAMNSLRASRATPGAWARRRAGRSRRACRPVPRPKWCIQTRFTNTRAVSGLSFDTISRARSSRPLPSRERLAVGVRDLHELSRDRFARPAGVAALEDARVVGPRRVVQHHRPRRSLRQPVLECAQELLVLGLRRAVREQRQEAPVECERRVGGRIGAVEHAAQRLGVGVVELRRAARAASFHCLSTSASSLP